MRVVLDAVLPAVQFCRTRLAHCPLVELWHVLVFAVGSASDNLCHNSLLDSLQILSLLEFHLIVVTKLNVSAMVRARNSKPAGVRAGASLASP